MVDIPIIDHMSQKLTTLQNDPKTSRTGTTWTAEEEQQILESIQNGMEYEQIALKVQRSVNSVKSRMMENYIRKVLVQEMTLEEVSLLLKIPMDLLTVAKRRYESKTQGRKPSTTETTSENPKPKGTRQPRNATQPRNAAQPRNPTQPENAAQTKPKPKPKPKTEQDLKYMPILVEIRDYLKTLVDNK